MVEWQRILMECIAFVNDVMMFTELHFSCNQIRALMKEGIFELEFLQMVFHVDAFGHLCFTKR